MDSFKEEIIANIINLMNIDCPAAQLVMNKFLKGREL